MKILLHPVRTLVPLPPSGCVALLLACVCSLGTTSVSAAPRIDTVSRTTVCDGQGTDFSPLAEDDRDDQDSSPNAGAFTGYAAVPITLNDNVALFECAQNSNVNLTDLTFSGAGTAHIVQESRFDANDTASGAFFQGSSGSSFTIFFTLTNTGKVSLTTTLNSTRSFSSGAVPSGVGVSTSIQLKRGSTVVWSRSVQNGETLTFTGDVALAAGQYQLTVNAGSNVTLYGTGTQFAETNAGFTISGALSENPGGGGKKGRK